MLCVQLAGVAGTSVLLTQHERERLEELLEDLEEDQNNTDSSSHTPKVHLPKSREMTECAFIVLHAENKICFYMCTFTYPDTKENLHM